MGVLHLVSSGTSSGADIIALTSAQFAGLQCLVSVQNAAQISASYGSEALIAARNWVFAASQIATERHGAPVIADWDRTDAVVVSLPQDVSRASIIAEVLETLLVTIASYPVVCGDQAFHVVPSLDLLGLASVPVSTNDEAKYCGLAAAQMQFGGDAVEDNEVWQECYRQDMAAATALFVDMREGNLTFATQPICLMAGGRIGNAASYLYKECLLRRKSGSAVAQQIGQDILAVERVGLVCLLDNFVIHAVIERLQSNPDLRLGANVSAQSAACDAWWGRLCEKLQNRSDIAERLVIEITETASITCLPIATEFALRLKGLGCKISMDDFGVGRDAIRNLTALDPDIVKIDALFVRQARNSEKDRQALKLIVRLCKALGGVVVAEGIETLADSEIASRAGAVWQQGYFISSPSVEPRKPSKAQFLHQTSHAFGRRSIPVASQGKPVNRLAIDNDKTPSIIGSFVFTGYAG